MKRALEYLVAVLLVGATITVAVLALDSKSHIDKGTVVSTKSKPVTHNPTACVVFTLPDAKQLLGATAKGGANPIYDTPQGDLDVSSCNYVQDSGSNAPVAATKSATLLLRAPKTDKGVVSNQNQFGRLRSGNVQDVAGYGDTAYWDAEHGQLNILKNNTWYILSFGAAAPASRSLDQTKQMADLLINKL